MFKYCKNNGIPECTWHFVTYIEVWPDDDGRSKHVAALNIINNKIVLDVYIILFIILIV
jgi:hypothetical protein